MTWVVLAVLVVTVLALWVAWTAHRIDRLHARVAAARASLDAQLARRAVAADALATGHAATLGAALSGRLQVASRAAREAGPATQEAAQNDLGRVLSEAVTVLPADRLGELREAVTRVAMARRFYNDAVRDAADLQAQRVPRWFRLAGGRPRPAYFQIDDRAGAPPA